MKTNGFHVLWCVGPGASSSVAQNVTFAEEEEEEEESCQHHKMTARRYKSVGNTKTWSTVGGRNNRTKSKHANAAKFCDLNIFGLPLSPHTKLKKGIPLRVYNINRTDS